MAFNDDTIIWHYLDFAKFVSILDSSALFFSSASNLEDPFEGSVPLTELMPPPVAGQERVEDARLVRDLVLVSSWHTNPEESFAMWKLYSSPPEAVAIQTTVGRLRKALSAQKDFEVSIRKVNYIDYSRDRLPADPSVRLAPFVCKARPYSYENEVRAIVDLFGKYWDKISAESEALSADEERFLDTVLIERGAYVPLVLTDLLENVYVAPTAGQWFLRLVESICAKYNLSIKVRQSVLSHPPRL